MTIHFKKFVNRVAIDMQSIHRNSHHSQVAEEISLICSQLEISNEKSSHEAIHAHNQMDRSKIPFGSM